MKTATPYQAFDSSCSEASLPGEAMGWWDVHTHRHTADWQHTLLSCHAADPFSRSLFPSLPVVPEASQASPLPAHASECLGGMPLYLSVGIHPWYLTEANWSAQWEWLSAAVHDERVVAVGEAGLDKITGASFALQCMAFRRVALLADAMQLPLLIHAVKASNEIIELKKALKPRTPWIIHGFRGKPALAQAYLRQGIYLSFGEKYQEAALRVAPPERLLMETDESPADIRALYLQAAKVLDISPESLREQVQQNVDRLFFGH